MVLKAVNFARENQADGIIGIGGGSSLDTAKLVAALATGHQNLKDIYGVDKITTSPLPLIQIPTTSGTGSEVTPIAIVTRPDDTKQGVVSAKLYAKAVILDPVLTLGLPPQITAATAIDAMVHAIEAFTSVHRKNPVSDMLAIQAISLLSENIKDAVHQGTNMEARSAMLLGSMMAGQAFANAPVAAVHALAYPLGGIYHIPHGLSVNCHAKVPHLGGKLHLKLPHLIC
jgi:alcohol dehydrogenase